MFILLIFTLLLVGAAYGFGMRNVNCLPRGGFDLTRYMGEWYELARFDHPAERGMTGVKVSYVLCSDGRVDMLVTGRNRRTGRPRRMYAKAYATPVAGRLKVSFFWFFYSEYNVLEVGDGYRWALVGRRTSRYLWILSRTPNLPALTMTRILHLARKRGYKTERLLFIGQPPRP